MTVLAPTAAGWLAGSTIAAVRYTARLRAANVAQAQQLAKARAALQFIADTGRGGAT